MKLHSPMVSRLVEDARRDPERFWDRAARALPWLRTWDRVFQWEPPSFRWYVGGQTNLAYSALDPHVAAGRGGHAALIYFNERGDRQVLTYNQLLYEVERAAGALRALGVQRGDRVTLYLPTSPEAVILMLACARVGAIHLVVFAGFGAQALADRLDASGSRFLFAADVTWRKGREVPLRPIVDAALQAAGRQVERVIRIRPHGNGAASDTSLTWNDFLRGGEGHSGAYVALEANEPAFILATSGTTAKPKLAVHTHGGYQVHVVTMGRWAFGLESDDVWWVTSDVGWIGGHSYMVYAPLILGATTVLFEGALDYGGPAANWRTAVEECGATGIFTSPTAVRTLMRYGDAALSGINHSRLKRVVCAGEVLNAPAWAWLQNTVLEDRIPVIDSMWQTETAGPIVGNPYGICLMPIKPGSAGIPMPGIDAAVVDADGRECAANEPGLMVIRRPFPGLTPSLWREPDRFARDYWTRVPGVYCTGDSARIDADGYVWFAGRADEIIKIAGHRIGAIEVESTFLKHQAVAECGVIGRPDATRGEVVSAFVVLKNDREPSDALRDELLQVVRHEFGPVVVVGDVHFVEWLPKTRTGKIMRRVLKAVALDRDPGDITAIDEESSLEEAQHAWRRIKGELTPRASRP